VESCHQACVLGGVGSNCSKRQQATPLRLSTHESEQIVAFFENSPSFCEEEFVASVVRSVLSTAQR